MMSSSSKIKLARYFEFLSTPGWRWPKNKSFYKFPILKKKTIFWISKFFQCMKWLEQSCLVPKISLLVIFVYAHVCNLTSEGKVLFPLKWILDVFYFQLPYWCTILVHQCMVSAYWSTIKLRETFQQITQKWCATKTWDLKNLFMWLRIY